MIDYTGGGRSVSPVVSVILLVGITVILSATIGMTVFNTSQSSGEGVQSAVRFVPTDEGVTIEVISVSSEVEVRYNGEIATNLTSEDVGRSIAVPTAPGDTVTIVSNTSGSQTVVATHTAEYNPSLLAYYRADGTPNDSSGNQLHAENVRLNETRPGVVGDSYNFTGGKNSTQSELRLPRTLMSEFQTVCFYINPSLIKSSNPGDDGTTWDDHNIFHDNGKNDPNNEYGWHLYNDTTVSVGYGGEGLSKSVLTYSGLSENSWTFLCQTVSKERIRLYVNGTLVNSTPAHHGALNYSDRGSQPLFGRHVPNLDKADGLYGKLDEIRFYTRPLSSEEVEILYNGTNGVE